MSTRQYTIVARSWNRMHNFFYFITQMISWWFYSCVAVIDENIFFNMLAALNDRDDSQYYNFNGYAQLGNSSHMTYLHCASLELLHLSSRLCDA